MSSHVPEYHNYEEFQNRTKKREEIIKLGVDPYPHKFTPSHTTQELAASWENKEIGGSDDAASGYTPNAVVAGRLILFRAMGKNAFAQIQDNTGRIQIMFNRELTEVIGYTPKDKTSLSALKFIEKKLDLGDIIGVEGNLFRTHKGELTLYAKKVTLLCKTLLPLPDKHSGLADKGVRYRKRWLDLITDQDSMKRFYLRSQIVQMIRQIFYENSFSEVETPILQNSYGGAEARPFYSHLNALDQDMFLRISLEIPLKKLIIGGMSKIFEMGKAFRNEGIDRTHNPEFTLLEAYAAYWDYNDLMSFVETLFETIAIKLFGDTKIKVPFKDKEEIIELKAPWKRITMKDSIKEYANIDVDTLSDEQMRTLLVEKSPIEKEQVYAAARGSLIAYIFEEFVEYQLIQPHHVTDHPIETTPLCKLHRDPSERKQGIVERFESFILGGEFTNAYSELNDPVLQRDLLVDQSSKKAVGEHEVPPLDEEFIEAICQGLPPTGGFGIGVDRLVMLFAHAKSIKDVLFFPLMRPEE